MRFLVAHDSLALDNKPVKFYVIEGWLDYIIATAAHGAAKDREEKNVRTHDRRDFVAIQGCADPVAQRSRYWVVVILACGGALLGTAYLLAPHRVQHTAVPAPLTIHTNAVLPQHHFSGKHSEFTVRSPSVASTRAAQERHVDADAALQNLWRISGKPTDTRVKINALERYARAVMAASSSSENDSLERVASAAFDQDPAMARAAALDSSVPEIQLAAIANLAQGTDVQAPATLAMVAGDSDPDIRRAAIEGLGLLLKNDPQVRYTLGYLTQTEMDPDNAMLIEDWLMDSGDVVEER